MLAHAAKCPERGCTLKWKRKKQKEGKERTTSDAESITEVVT